MTLEERPEEFISEEMVQLEKYYTEQYQRILGVNEVPKEVSDLHKKVRFMYDRLGGGTLLPQTMVLIVALAGSQVKNIGKRGKAIDPNTPPLPVQG